MYVQYYVDSDQHLTRKPEYQLIYTVNSYTFISRVRRSEGTGSELNIYPGQGTHILPRDRELLSAVSG